jgi:hypothetical protein
LGQLVELFKNVTGAMPNRSVSISDPQFEEVYNDVNPHKTGEIPELQVLTKQHEALPQNTLKDYHDIINNLVDKKMEQTSIEQNLEQSSRIHNLLKVTSISHMQHGMISAFPFGVAPTKISSV